MSAHRLSIGVMRTGGGVLSDEVRERAYRFGRAIAEQGAVLITGACPGLPYEAVRGAKAAGGWSSVYEHLAWRRSGAAEHRVAPEQPSPRSRRA
jgi:SLOG cluster4 family